MRFGLLLPAKHFATRVRTRHRRRRVLDLHVIVSIHSTEIQFPADIARPFGIARAVSQFVIVSIAGGSKSPLATDDHSTSVRLFFIVHPLVTHHVVTPRRLIFAEFAIPNDVVSGFAVDHDVVVIVGVVHRDVVVGWCC